MRQCHRSLPLRLVHRMMLMRPRVRPGLMGAVVVAALVLLAGIEAWARDTRSEPWAQGVTQYQRFLLEPHLDAGFRYLRQGRHAEALKEFKRAKEIASTNPWISLYLAQAYVANGEWDQAVEVLRMQRQLTPDHQEILCHLGVGSDIHQYALKTMLGRYADRVLSFNSSSDMKTSATENT